MNTISQILTTAAVTVVGTVATSPFWGSLFNFRAKKIEVDATLKQGEDQIIERAYGGVISDLKTQVINLNNRLDQTNENLSKAYKKIAILDRKVAIYEFHLSQNEDGKKVVQTLNDNIKHEF